MRISRRSATVAVAAALLGGVPAAIADVDDRASDLRVFIGQRVGGLRNLTVPPDDASIPLPRQPDGTVNPRYKTTEAKRYLGKLLFHDPVRTARVNQNEGQPRDLPTNTAFGGTLPASAPGVQGIVDATRQTGSCGSCHIGEAAGKAGQQLNFNTGGEGRGYTDEDGNFFPRRRPQSILVKQRDRPLFPGDVLVDSLPTLTDIWIDRGTRTVTTPAYYYHLADPNDPLQTLNSTGRLDQLDSVARMSPGMVGFAFNNRLLLGGFAGEPQSTPGSLNPFSDPAQENLTLLLLDAHRMLNFQSAELLKIPAFVKLFRDAFPEEAAMADAGHDMTLLVNDVTVLRATSTFLRTIVTRNTPFDQFLAGDDRALTPAQRRGARLFFAPATGGAGGAGCSGCHSGPMLNKQPNDPDIAGLGAFVEENFFNVGVGDHPVQALNALARGRLNRNRLGADGFPYHAEDTGRQEITHNPADAFKFRSLTMRQLKDGRNFLHSGSFTKIQDVVEYFNAGIPEDPTAGRSRTLSERFTNPRGPGYPRGLGLSKRQVEDLTDFLENALYDPALVKYDPRSTTDTLQPNERDLTYSRYRPDLAALGAKDGVMLSGLAIDDNDPLSRRDQGLEFLDVTSRAQIVPIDRDRGDRNAVRNVAYRITNTSRDVIDTHLLIVARGLPRYLQLVNASGRTKAGDPYLRVYLKDGVLVPGQSIVARLEFGGKVDGVPALSLLSGQGQP